MGDNSQVMHEEALVARIICTSKQIRSRPVYLVLELIYLKAQARAIYGPKYPHGSTFDIIYSSDTRGDGVVSWVIVYPQPDAAAWKNGKAVSDDWIPVLKSERIVTGPHSHPVFPTRYLLEKSYNNLIEKLRVQMIETMATMGK